MRRYETLIIFPDTLSDEDAEDAYERVQEILSDQEGELVDENWWGKRQFAYEINHRTHGYYGVLDYRITPEGREELERRMKLDDDVLRFKTVRPQLRIRKPA